MSKFFILIAAGLLLSSCATAPPPSSIQPLAFLVSADAPSTATGTIWADQFLYISAVDGERTPYFGKGTIAQSQAIALEVPAGRHALKLYSPALANRPSVDIEVTAGHTYVLKITPDLRIQSTDLGANVQCEASYQKLGIANFTHNVRCGGKDSTR